MEGWVLCGPIRPSLLFPEHHSWRWCVDQHHSLSWSDCKTQRGTVTLQTYSFVLISESIPVTRSPHSWCSGAQRRTMVWWYRFSMDVDSAPHNPEGTVSNCEAETIPELVNWTLYGFFTWSSRKNSDLAPRSLGNICPEYSPVEEEEHLPAVFFKLLGQKSSFSQFYNAADLLNSLVESRGINPTVQMGKQRLSQVMRLTYGLTQKGSAGAEAMPLVLF